MCDIVYEEYEYIYLFLISWICSQLDSLSEEKQQEIQKALHLFSFGHGPPKNLQEARRHTYRFWDTQPVPKIGMMHSAQVETTCRICVHVYKRHSFFFRWESDITRTNRVRETQCSRRAILTATGIHLGHTQPGQPRAGEWEVFVNQRSPKMTYCTRLNKIILEIQWWTIYTNPTFAMA